MFIEKQTEAEIKEYYELLKIMGSLSKLFSDNIKPYIDYRITENLFCMCLNAKNLSRSDCSADASKNGTGIGIKTFLNTATRSSMQKIAEFNSKRNEYAELNFQNLIQKVSSLRNERIDVTKRLYGLNSLIYHCTVRDDGQIHIIENPMDEININKIYITKGEKRNNVIYFNDSNNEYSFNISKSVLYKRFSTKNVIKTLEIEILENPYGLIKELFYEKNDLILHEPSFALPTIFLPLYSVKNGIKFVPEKSGLNQWNAGGRKRNENELYIPIPANVHKKNPKFFPDKNLSFNLTLPDGTIMSAKVCQDNKKALMSNPNSELGEWLLRHILQIKEKTIVTYAMLENLGIDSVIICRVDASNYTIDFTSFGKYEEFINQ